MTTARASGLTQVQDLLPHVWLDQPDDVELRLWYQPTPQLQPSDNKKPHQLSVTASQSSTSSSDPANPHPSSTLAQRVEKRMYLKSSITALHSPYLEACLKSDEEGGGWHNGKRRKMCDEHGAVVEEGQLKVLELQVEGAEHMRAAVALVQLMYTGSLPGCEAISPKMLLVMLQMADCWGHVQGVQMSSRALCLLPQLHFPVAEAYEMIRTSGTFEASLDVMRAAAVHLCHDFADASAVLGSTSHLQRFLELTYIPALVVMSEVSDTAAGQEARTRLFSHWCSGPTGLASILHLSSTEDFPLKSVFAIGKEMQELPGFSEVMLAAHLHLHQTFDDSAALLGSTSQLRRFLDLPFAAVLVLLDRNTSIPDNQHNREQLFSQWCSGPAGQASIQQLCSVTHTRYLFSNVFSLGPEMQVLPAFLPVTIAAEKLLLKVFGNTSIIIAVPALLERFSSIPLLALLFLLRNEGLVLDAEVTALLLLDVWLDANPCNADDLTLLRSAVRYSRLPSSYLTGLLASRPSALPELHMNEVIHYLLTKLHTVESYSTDWYKPSRAPAPNQYKPQADLQWAVSRDSLFKLLDAGVSEIITSPRVYAAGFLWSIDLFVDDTGAVSRCVSVNGSSLKKQRIGVEFKNKLVCDFRLSMGKARAKQCANRRDQPVGSMTCVQLREKPEESAKAAERVWWEHHLENGFVNFSAVISNIIL